MLGGARTSFEIPPPWATKGNESDWNQHHSDWEKYKSEDYYLIYAWNNDTAIITKVIRALLWSSYTIVTILALLKLLSPNAHPLLERLPDGGLLLLLTTLMLLAWAIAWALQVTGEKTADIRRNIGWTNTVVQIVPSTGSLNFGFGSTGICIRGIGCQYLIEWSAFENVALKIVSKVGNRLSWSDSDLTKSTHIVVRLKDSGDHEQYIIIPRRFFTTRVTKYETFYSELKKKDQTKPSP